MIDQHRAHERILYEYLRHRLVGQPGDDTRLQQRWHLTDTEQGEEITQRFELGQQIEQEAEQEDGAGLDTSGQLLLEPVVIELPAHQAATFSERLPVLAALGFACERFGGRSFLIRSVPVLAGMEGLTPSLPVLAAEAAAEEENWQDRFCAAVACHAAIRRGRALSLAEQRELLAQLRQTSAPAVCPHGSPLLLHYSQQFLARQFGW